MFESSYQRINMKERFDVFSPCSNVGYLLVTMILFSGQRALAQTNESSRDAGADGASSPYTLVRSIESIGLEVLSLLSFCPKEEAHGTARVAAVGGKSGRRKIKAYLSLESEAQSTSTHQKQSHDGSDLCSLYMGQSSAARATSLVLSAQAVYFPRQKRIVLELDSPLQALSCQESKRRLLVVRRSTSDTSDTNGTIIVNNKRLYIRNGEYEVVNNTVSFYLD